MGMNDTFIWNFLVKLFFLLNKIRYINLAAALVASREMEQAVQAYVTALQYNPVSKRYLHTSRFFFSQTFSLF